MTSLFSRRVLCVAAALATALISVRPAIADQSSNIDYKTARLQQRLPAVRATGPIVIDGRLDEEAWRAAPLATDFIQNEPHAGAPATERTDVRVLYDDTFLYVGVFAQETHRSRIIVNELKKDFDAASSDTFMMLIDTFHDGRNGYQFATNPLGAKHDVQNANDGREINASWDAIWDVKTRITDEGWYAEMAIPFRTLKFPSADPQTWGLNFLRRIRHLNEDSHWAPLPRFYKINRVSLAGTLEGLQGLHPGRNVRVKPYILGSRGDVGTSSGPRRQLDKDVGIDVKYAMTTSLSWDFTVNTDFSQVEADEQQINLTRFSLFFPEKREFFLENSGIFQFGPTGAASSGGPSATSGRQNGIQQDLVFFFSRRIGLSDAGQAIPIAGGTRLTGRAGRLAVGAVSIQQRSQGVLPATNFTALRLRRNVLAGSDVGVMLLNKEATGGGANRGIGADANFRFFQNLNINGYLARTFSPGRAFSTAGRAIAGRAGINWRDNRWDLRTSYLTIGSRFNDELGFVPRVGVNQVNAYAGIFMRPHASSRWLREIAPHWELNAANRASGGLDSRYNDFHLLFTFQNSSTLTVGINPSVEEFVSPFAISRQRGMAIPAGRYSYDETFVLVKTNPAARLSVNGRYSSGTFYNGDKQAYQFGGAARVNARLNFSASLSKNDITLPAGAFTTWLATGRVNVNFTTRMFLNALAQYNTDARQWSSNVRFNIIHRPLSDVFFVYNERRDSRTMDLIDRAFVAKLTYLIAF